MSEPIYTQIKIRRDTRKNWNQVNPTPAQGEICIILDETPTPLKIGDGVHAWADLPEQSFRITKGFEFSGTINPTTELESLGDVSQLGFLIATEPGIYKNLNLSKNIQNFTIFVPNHSENTVTWEVVDLGVPFINKDAIPKFRDRISALTSVILVTDDSLAFEHKKVLDGVYYIPFASLNGVLKQVFAYKIGSTYYTSTKVLPTYMKSNLSIYDNKLFQHEYENKIYIYTGRDLKLISECFNNPKFKLFVDGEVEVLDDFAPYKKGFVVFSKKLCKFLYCVEGTSKPIFYLHWDSERDYMENGQPRSDTLFLSNNKMFFWNGYVLAELNSSAFSLKVVQETGSSKEDVMSQWAVTNEFKKIKYIPEYNVKFNPEVLEIKNPSYVEMSWDIKILGESPTNIVNMTISKNGEYIFKQNLSENTSKGVLEVGIDALSYLNTFEFKFEIDGVTYSKLIEYLCENPVFLGFSNTNESNFDIKQNSVKTILTLGESKDISIQCPEDGLYMYLAIPHRMGKEQNAVQLTSFESNGIEIPLESPQLYNLNEISYNLYITTFKLLAGNIENIDLTINIK